MIGILTGIALVVGISGGTTIFIMKRKKKQAEYLEFSIGPILSKK